MFSVRQIFVFEFLFVNTSPNIHIRIHIQSFLVAWIYLYSHSSFFVNLNIFIFVLNRGIQIYSYSYLVQKNIFVTHEGTPYGSGPIFSPTRPSGPSWFSSREVHIFIHFFYLYIPFPCNFFRGLLLALRSHDKFQASHWSTPRRPPPRTPHPFF